MRNNLDQTMKKPDNLFCFFFSFVSVKNSGQNTHRDIN